MTIDQEVVLQLKSGEVLVAGEGTVISCTVVNGLVICAHAVGTSWGAALYCVNELEVSARIGELVSRLRAKAGVAVSGIEAKLIGASAARGRDCLESLGVRVVAEASQGGLERKLFFYTGTGRLRLSESPRKVAEVNRKRVMVVDDSRTIRDLLGRIFQADPGLEVVGVAASAEEAEVLIPQLNPDVLTLDIHMPGMDGVTFLEKLLVSRPMPVVMISSLTAEEGIHVMHALEKGAVDYVQKPVLAELEKMGPLICEKVRVAATVKVTPRAIASRAKTVVKSTGIDATKWRDVIAIGASTGGVEAIRQLLTALPAEIPPVVIVQHIPPVFSRAFAMRLNELCPFEVKEAQDGDELRAGRVLIAPGGFQMAVEPSAGGFKIRITSDAPVNRHRPSVDFLFDSVAKHLGKRSIGVILTGMGGDGAQGLLKMRQAGASTIGQDQASCVVYGMPKEAANIGACEKVAALPQIPDLILNYLRSNKAA